MIYLEGDGAEIYVLEPGNIEQLKEGKPIKLRDGKTILVYTPDPVWLADKIAGSNGDAAAIGRLIDESVTRPEKPSSGRKPHGEHLQHFGGDDL